MLSTIALLLALVTPLKVVCNHDYQDVVTCEVPYSESSPVWEVWKDEEVVDRGRGLHMKVTLSFTTWRKVVVTGRNGTVTFKAKLVPGHQTIKIHYVESRPE